MPVTLAGTDARESAVLYSGRRHPSTNVFRRLHRRLSYTQRSPNVLGLNFLTTTREEDTYLFKYKISSTGIYTGFCAVARFLKSCRKFLFLDLL